MLSYCIYFIPYFDNFVNEIIAETSETASGWRFNGSCIGIFILIITLLLLIITKSNSRFSFYHAKVHDWKVTVLVHHLE